MVPLARLTNISGIPINEFMTNERLNELIERTKKGGGERLNFTAFYEALLEAKGVNLASESAGGIGKGGRKLSYVATVQGNGNLLIGKAYTALLDLKPGDNFEIKMGRKGFRLVPEGEG